MNLLEIGFARDQGVIAAFIPDDGTMLSEAAWQDNGRQFTAFYIPGPMGKPKLLDLFPLTDSRDVKFWLLRKAAVELGFDVIEPVCHCAAEDFNYESIPRSTQTPGTVLAIRMYERGPYIKLESLGGGEYNSPPNDAPVPQEV